MDRGHIGVALTADEAARRSLWESGSHLKCKRTAVRLSLHRIASQLNAFFDIDELEALNENHVYLGSVPWPNVSRRDHYRDSIETTSFRETVADLSK